MKHLFKFGAAWIAAAFVAVSAPVRAQVSFATVVHQALQNSPRVRNAQDDVKKARSGVAVMKDIFIPSVVLGGGLGTASGITLSVPTIFTVSAQSLIYSPQQVSYVHGAKLDLKAAGYALADARGQAAEDAADTYLTIGHDQLALEALSQEFEYRLKLVNIIQDRVEAHLDRELDLKQARRDALQMRMQIMQMQDDLDAQRAHLSEQTGIPEAQLIAAPETVPDLPQLPEQADDHMPETPGVLAAEAGQQSREVHAHADAQYTWKPIVSFGAQYGRVSPIENVSEFYNIHGDYNSASVGVQIQFPVLDRVRAAAAKISAADAAHGAVDLETQRLELTSQWHKLHRAAAELNVKAQLANLDYGIAQDQLQSVLIALHSFSGGPPTAPQDEQKARIQERQSYLEMIDARLDASCSEIGYLRQTGQLEDWLQSILSDGSTSR